MRRNLSPHTLVAVSLMCIAVLAACNNNGAVLQYVAVAPTSATIQAGTTQQFTATAFFSNGTRQDATNLATWTSSNQAVATIFAGGVASGLTSGTATITATIIGATPGSAILNVNQLQSIAVTPGTATIAIGKMQQFAATGTFKNFDGSTSMSDVSSQATWSSSMPTVATIDNTGLATGVAGGTTGITAALNGVTSSPVATLTVSGTAVAVSLQLSPASPTIAVRNAVTFTAQELWSDNTLHPLSGPVTWSSGTAANAEIGTSNGIAVGLAAGTSTITATEGTLTGPATLTVVTGTAHYAYVSNINDGTISEFSVNATSSTPFTSTGMVSQTQPVQVIVHPSGKYVYTIDGSTSSVAVYDVNAGALVLTTQPLQVAGSGNSNFGATDPFGRFFYVVDSGGTTSLGTIFAFSISPTDGSLTAIQGSPFTASVDSPVCIVIDPTGSYLYVTNSGNNTVSAYSINQTTGALTALSTPTYSTGTSPQFATLDPTGTHLYIANSTGNSVTAYTINTTNGLLTSVGADFPVTGATSILNVAVAPSGSFLYVLDTGNSTTVKGQVYGFNIATGGAVGTAITGTPIATGLGPIGIAIDPTGSLIATENDFDGPPGTISLFSVGTTGTLTALTPVTVGSAPIFVVFYNAP